MFKNEVLPKIYKQVLFFSIDVLTSEMHHTFNKVLQVFILQVCIRQFLLHMISNHLTQAFPVKKANLSITSIGTSVSNSSFDLEYFLPHISCSWV